MIKYHVKLGWGPVVAKACLTLKPCLDDVVSERITSCIGLITARFPVIRFNLSRLSKVLKPELHYARFVQVFNQVDLHPNRQFQNLKKDLHEI